MDETVDVPGRHDAADPRVRLASAVLYAAGIALVVVGTVGAFVWAPLLWSAGVGLVVIAVSFAISGGRF